MKTVEIGNWCRVSIFVHSQVVRVEDSNESDDDAGNSQNVEDGVKQFVPNATATTAGPVHQHRLSHEVDESRNHKHGMQVEL